MPTRMRRIELMDLSDPKQAEIAVTMVGMSLKQAGPKSPTVQVTVSDDTPEGREKLQELIGKGYKVTSIKN